MIYAGYDMLNQSQVFMYNEDVISIPDGTLGGDFLSSLEFSKLENESTLEEDGVLVVIQSPWTHAIEYTPEVWDKINYLVT